jgi:hypothetical protein
MQQISSGRRAVGNRTADAALATSPAATVMPIPARKFRRFISSVPTCQQCFRRQTRAELQHI